MGARQTYVTVDDDGFIDVTDENTGGYFDDADALAAVREVLLPAIFGRWPELARPEPVAHDGPSIVVAVPPGLRVMFCELAGVTTPFMFNPATLSAPVTPSPTLGVLGDPFGFPVYDAERWEPGEPVGDTPDPTDQTPDASA